MNLNRLTEKAQEAVVAAQQLAARLNHSQIDPEHLLSTLVAQQNGIVPAVLRRMQVDPVALGRVIEQDLNKRPKAYGGSEPALGSRMRTLFDAAEKEAAQLKDEYLSTEHFLLAIAGEGGRTPGVVALQAVGATRDRILETLVAVRGTQRVTDQSPEAKYEALEKYGRDLTALARRRQARSGDRARRRDPARRSRCCRAAPRTTRC